MLNILDLTYAIEAGVVCFYFMFELKSSVKEFWSLLPETTGYHLSNKTNDKQVDNQSSPIFVSGR